MSSNKTIKALREQMATMEAELRGLRPRVAIAVDFPPPLPECFFPTSADDAPRVVTGPSVALLDTVERKIAELHLSSDQRQSVRERCLAMFKEPPALGAEAQAAFNSMIRTGAEGMVGPEMARQMFPGAYPADPDAPSADDWRLAGIEPGDSAILEAREQYRDQLCAIGMTDEQQRAFWDRVDSGEAYFVAPLKRYDVEPFDPKDWPVVAPGQRLIVLRDAEPAPKEKWSLTGQNGAWDYDSLAELVRDNYGHTRDSAGPMGCDSDLVEGSTVYRAIECKDDPARFLPDADDVIGHMADQVSDSDASEWADNYPEVDDAARAELEKALEPLQAWARKHCQPDFFTVKNITPYTITEQDVGQ